VYSLQERLTTEFRRQFDHAPAFIVRAPGRVNLIGEHTDYNNGFALPMAIDRAIWIALRPREDRRVVVHSLDFPKPADFSLDAIRRGKNWDAYVRGVGWVLQKEGYSLRGWEGVLASDIPVGAGLSSSAALELAVARAFWAVSRWDWHPTKMALMAQKTENEWLGLQTGVMDQLISARGKKGHALLIDCRDLTSRLVPLPTATAIVVLDTAPAAAWSIPPTTSGLPNAKPPALSSTRPPYGKSPQKFSHRTDTAQLKRPSPQPHRLSGMTQHQHPSNP
jgi:galactokinase